MARALFTSPSVPRGSKLHQVGDKSVLIAGSPAVQGFCSLRRGTGKGGMVIWVGRTGLRAPLPVGPPAGPCPLLFSSHSPWQLPHADALLAVVAGHQHAPILQAGTGVPQHQLAVLKRGGSAGAEGAIVFCHATTAATTRQRACSFTPPSPGTCVSATPHSARMPLPELSLRCPGSCTHTEKRREWEERVQMWVGTRLRLASAAGTDTPAVPPHIRDRPVLAPAAACCALACSGKLKIGVGLMMLPEAGSAGSQIFINPSNEALTIWPSHTCGSGARAGVQF